VERLSRAVCEKQEVAAREVEVLFVDFDGKSPHWAGSPYDSRSLDEGLAGRG
jgi:hypothetical protein